MDTYEPPIFELSGPGKCGANLPAVDVPETPLPAELLRTDDLEGMPELSETEVTRHFTRISQRNFCIDTGMYPLGSCTMKYNPKVHEEAARLPGFAFAHPLQGERHSQGALQLMFELQEMLGEIAGLDAVALQPAAGAQGEFTGILVFRAYHRERGNVDLDDLRSKLGPRTAGLMLTNPNTLGLFDEHVRQVAQLVHEAGGLMYGDGANFNAILGIVRPGEIGFDFMHYNLHKTFTTPHGGGGPGAGPVGCKDFLAP